MLVVVTIRSFRVFSTSITSRPFSPTEMQRVPSSKTIGSPCWSLDLVVDAVLPFAEQVERAVVEHVAVLVHLHERGSPVRSRAAEHLGHVLTVVVDRPRHERGLGAQRQGDRVERVVY